MDPTIGQSVAHYLNYYQMQGEFKLERNTHAGKVLHAGHIKPGKMLGTKLELRSRSSKKWKGGFEVKIEVTAPNDLAARLHAVFVPDTDFEQLSTLRLVEAQIHGGVNISIPSQNEVTLKCDWKCFGEPKRMDEPSGCLIIYCVSPLIGTGTERVRELTFILSVKAQEDLTFYGDQVRVNLLAAPSDSSRYRPIEDEAAKFMRDTNSRELANLQIGNFEVDFQDALRAIEKCQLGGVDKNNNPSK